MIGYLVILFDGISTLLGYLMPELVFYTYYFVCIDKLVEIISINFMGIQPIQL